MPPRKGAAQVVSFERRAQPRDVQDSDLSRNARQFSDLCDQAWSLAAAVSTGPTPHPARWCCCPRTPTGSARRLRKSIGELDRANIGVLAPTPWAAVAQRPDRRPIGAAGLLAAARPPRPGRQLGKHARGDGSRQWPTRSQRPPNSSRQDRQVPSRGARAAECHRCSRDPAGSRPGSVDLDHCWRPPQHRGPRSRHRRPTRTRVATGRALPH